MPIVLLACLVLTFPPPKPTDPFQLNGVTVGRFVANKPTELNTSDASIGDGLASDLARRMRDDKLPVADRADAARSLWYGQSRPDAAAVLQFVAGPPLGGDDFRALQRDVEAALKPAAVLEHINARSGLGGRSLSADWGYWLAYLRPQPEYVPVLLDVMKDKAGPSAGAILALGNSGDPRALPPLLELVKSGGGYDPCHAARALRYLGRPEAEPTLIAALTSDTMLLRACAALTLAQIGTTAALPALERNAADKRYTGAIAVQSSAEYAVGQIKARAKK